MRICIYLQIYVSGYHFIPRCMHNRMPVLVQLLNSIDPSVSRAKIQRTCEFAYDSLMAKKHSDQIFVNFPSTARLSYAILTAARDVRKFKKRRCRQLFLFLSLGMRDKFLSSMRILHARCFRQKLISELIHRYIFGERYISRSRSSLARREKELADMDFENSDILSALSRNFAHP